MNTDSSIKSIVPIYLIVCLNKFISILHNQEIITSPMLQANEGIVVDTKFNILFEMKFDDFFVCVLQNRGMIVKKSEDIHYYIRDRDLGNDSGSVATGILFKL